MYYSEKLDGELKDKKVSFFKYLFCYDKFSGNTLPVTALPYPCFSNDYDTPDLKRICLLRNISSAILVLHFIAIIIITSCFGPELMDYFNK
ncbi:MAG TPA: hypothetical protein VLZ75_12435 [Chitinophagales bacterium]|nr:hypothetical protein [Chitinophagales bacterium]